MKQADRDPRTTYLCGWCAQAALSENPAAHHRRCTGPCVCGAVDHEFDAEIAQRMAGFLHIDVDRVYVEHERPRLRRARRAHTFQPQDQQQVNNDQEVTMTAPKATTKSVSTKAGRKAAAEPAVPASLVELLPKAAPKKATAAAKKAAPAKAPTKAAAAKKATATKAAAKPKAVAAEKATPKLKAVPTKATSGDGTDYVMRRRFVDDAIERNVISDVTLRYGGRDGLIKVALTDGQRAALLADARRYVDPANAEEAQRGLVASARTIIRVLEG